MHSYHFRISGIPSTIPFHLSALNDDQISYTEITIHAFIEKMKSYSEKDGEIAAIVFENILKRRGSSISTLKKTKHNKKMSRDSHGF